DGFCNAVFVAMPGENTACALATADSIRPMQLWNSCRRRVIAPILSVCALGLSWSCSSSSSETTDSVSYSCASPPANLAECTQDADCMTVEIWCYCGAQPVNGIARKYVATAQGCEQAA